MSFRVLLDALTDDPAGATFWLVMAIFVIEFIKVMKSTKQVLGWISLQVHHWRKGRAAYLDNAMYSSNDGKEEE